MDVNQLMVHMPAHVQRAMAEEARGENHILSGSFPERLRPHQWVTTIQENNQAVFVINTKPN